MKILFLILSFLPLSNAFCQYDTIIHPGQVTVATLIVDFQTYNFDGGNISYYDCPSCSNDTFPLLSEYVAPGDFGYMKFKLNPSMDIFFNGSIVWAGEGGIFYPTIFGIDPPFANSSINISTPDDFLTLDYDGMPMQGQNPVNDALLSWNAIRYLEITKIFSSQGFKSAVYFYAPAVGAFDAGPAKYIIFLYHQEGMVAVNEKEDLENYLKVYPNPVIDNLVIETNDQNEINQRYIISSVEGEEIFQGNCSVNKTIISCSDLETGIYLYTIVNAENRIIKQDRIMKQ